jgi:hypothetical protein
MRSAWSPMRSMSFETFFDVLPNSLLAFPMVLASDLISSSDERGSGSPSAFLRRLWLLSASTPTYGRSGRSAGAFFATSLPLLASLSARPSLLCVRLELAPFGGADSSIRAAGVGLAGGQPTFSLTPENPFGSFCPGLGGRPIPPFVDWLGRSA